MLIAGCSSSKVDRALADGFFDKNEDGTPDVFYEYVDDGYYELVDSNFDGNVDESNKYNSNHILVSQKLDQNFDGHLETEVIYEKGMASKERVDVNKDGVYEIVFLYESGQLSKSFKYYSQENARNMIGSVTFDYGYPSEEQLSETDKSVSEFANDFWK